MLISLVVNLSIHCVDCADKITKLGCIHVLCIDMCVHTLYNGNTFKTRMIGYTTSKEEPCQQLYMVHCMCSVVMWFINTVKTKGLF